MLMLLAGAASLHHQVLTLDAMMMLADGESGLYHARNAIRRWIVGRVWLDAFDLELIDFLRRSSEAEAEDAMT